MRGAIDAEGEEHSREAGEHPDDDREREEQLVLAQPELLKTRDRGTPHGPCSPTAIKALARAAPARASRSDGSSPSAARNSGSARRGSSTSISSDATRVFNA